VDAAEGVVVRAVLVVEGRDLVALSPADLLHQDAAGLEALLAVADRSRMNVWKSQLKIVHKFPPIFIH
jgi:hypothetical protein